MNRVHSPATLAVLGGLTLLGTTQLPRPVPAQPCLTPEHQEILSHMSLVELDDGFGGPCETIRISGVNLQVVNGLGATGTANCVGNLIVGYNELGSSFGDDRTGSHNIVCGSKNSFSRYGGLVAGTENGSLDDYACVTGGTRNRATGVSSSISGTPRAGSGRSSADDIAGAVLGGQWNLASAAHASVGGGNSNTADGNSSSVSGGSSRMVDDTHDWRAGTLFESD